MSGTASLSRSIAVVLASLSGLASCDANNERGEHARCRLGPGDTHPDVCASGLFCSTADVCTPMRTAGQDCDGSRPCLDALVCTSRGVCSELGDEGGVCARDAECAAGLVCNHGFVPEDATLGECHALVGVGEPCGWGGAGDDSHNPDVLFASGCAAGLVCVPAVPALPDDAALDPATSGCSGLDRDCGYVGMCAQPGSVADGGACLADDACSSGRCLHVKAPHGLETGGVFGEGGLEYLGAWPDRCAATDALAENALCSDAPEKCVAGTYCDLSTNVSRCVAWRQGIETGPCGDRSRPSLGSDLECLVGLVCVPLSGAMRCQVAGTAGAGAPCNSYECAPGFGCLLDGVGGGSCGALGDVGDDCAPGSLPCLQGLWCDGSGQCVEP